MRILALIACALVGAAAAPALRAQDSPATQRNVVNYVRYEHAGHASYGVLEGDSIREIEGDLFGAHSDTDRWVALGDVTLLPVTPARKVIAVGLNYQSHLGQRESATYPGLFAKYPTSLVGSGADIVRPPDAKNLHYEGEMVLVIGKTCHQVTRVLAMGCVFGITAGNDVSERDWQANDLQWFRAKASDTFGPVGPTIATGLDPDDVQVETRVNGRFHHRQLREPVRNPGARRPHLHGNAGLDEGHEARRRRRGGGGGRRHPSQQGGAGWVRRCR